MSPRSRGESVRHLAGWPLRRVLDPRVQWTVAEIDQRLGTGSAGRPPLHDRLDQIEGAVAAVARRIDEMDARIAAMEGAVSAGTQAAALERGAAEESFSAVLEGLRQLDARLAGIEAALPPGPDEG